MEIVQTIFRRKLVASFIQDSDRWNENQLFVSDI